jgi:hypothetical protein
MTKLQLHREMSPSMETCLSEVIVSLHPHKKYVASCKGTKYIRRPCWGLFVRRARDVENA